MQERQIIYTNLRDLQVAINTDKVLKQTVFVDYGLVMPLKLTKTLAQRNIRIVYVKNPSAVVITEVT